MSLTPKTLMLAAVLATAAGVQAQTPASAPAPAPATAPMPASTPAKKELVAKVLKLQQPAIEALARQMVEQPAMQMLQQASAAVRRLPEAQREAAARDIQAEARKYADEAVGIARPMAVQLAPSTIGVVLEERFTEAELREIVTILESPVNRKFQAAGTDMQRALGERLVTETRPSIEPKVKALEASIVKRLSPPATPASAPGQ